MTTFAMLWNNHPTIKGEPSLLDRGAYEYQCAVNLSAALIRSGVNMNSYRGQLSWQKGNPKYAIRAQELADWLASPVNPLFSKVEKYSGTEAFDKIRGRSGVVFFQNYWGRSHQGDHIDLWNGYRLTNLRSFVQIYLRIGMIGLDADYKESQSVWFWPIQ